ncbi:MAG: energy-coupled thiamine transporter ThiT [Clostridiales bacterium]|nr:energy-coupled thiamine transporter ThiT [Clostridiales bacterium]
MALSLQGFFESAAGITVGALIAVVALIIMAGAMFRGKRLSARTLTCSAVAVALSVALSFVSLFEMPQGGSITPCSMMFICIVGYWFGPAAGIMAGVADGFIQFIMKPWAVHPMQILLDYPLGFGALGLAGFFMKDRFLPKLRFATNNLNGERGFVLDGLQIGVAAGAMGRFCMSFLAGVIFYADSAGGGNPVIFSIVYNLSYILPELALSIIILSIPAVHHAIDYVALPETRARLTQ